MFKPTLEVLANGPDGKPIVEGEAEVSGRTAEGDYFSQKRVITDGKGGFCVPSEESSKQRRLRQHRSWLNYAVSD